MKGAWIKPTPREMYVKGVNDAAIYIYCGREMPALPNKPLRRSHGWAAGMVARYYGVSLQPNGRN
jgi:hypothetical protein